MKEVEYIKPNHPREIPLAVGEDFDKHIEGDCLSRTAVFDCIV